jgi:hypothetical protein
VRFSPNGRALEVLTREGEFALADPATGEAVEVVPPPEGDEIDGAAVSAAGLVAGAVGRSILFWMLPHRKSR